jgi:hypothetical protein
MFYTCFAFLEKLIHDSVWKNPNSYSVAVFNVIVVDMSVITGSNFNALWLHGNINEFCIYCRTAIWLSWQRFKMLNWRIVFWNRVRCVCLCKVNLYLLLYIRRTVILCSESVARLEVQSVDNNRKYVCLLVLQRITLHMSVVTDFWLKCYCIWEHTPLIYLIYCGVSTRLNY